MEDNTQELYAIFNRLLEEFKKTPYNVKLCINTQEDITVELTHFNRGYKYGNRTVNFYAFYNLEKLRKLENDAIEIMRNNKLLIREF